MEMIKPHRDSFGPQIFMFLTPSIHSKPDEFRNFQQFSSELKTEEKFLNHVMVDETLPEGGSTSERVDMSNRNNEASKLYFVR